MKTLQRIAILLVSVALISACTSYEPNEYGPVDFEITLEGPFFEGSIAEDDSFAFSATFPNIRNKLWSG